MSASGDRVSCMHIINTLNTTQNTRRQRRTTTSFAQYNIRQHQQAATRHTRHNQNTQNTSNMLLGHSNDQQDAAQLAASLGPRHSDNSHTNITRRSSTYRHEAQRAQRDTHIARQVVMAAAAYSYTNNKSLTISRRVKLAAPALWLGAGLCVLLVALLANADYASQQQQQQQHIAPIQQQQLAGYGNNNDQQQQQQQGPVSKAKKIQIVYIKVPLAKLKPSLAQNGASSGNEYAASSAHAPTNDAAAANATGYQAANKGEQNETKSQGSQSIEQQQQQHIDASSDDGGSSSSSSLAGSSGNDDGSAPVKTAADQSAVSPSAAAAVNKQQQQQSSFLIPMAVVQTSAEPEESSPSASHQTPNNNNNNNNAFDSSNAAAPSNQRQQQQQQSMMYNSFNAAPSGGDAFGNMAFGGQSPFAFAHNQHMRPQMHSFGPAAFQQHQHAHNFGDNAAAIYGRSQRQSRHNSFNFNNQNQLAPQMLASPSHLRGITPMQQYRNMLMEAASVSHGINHGFMSSFLMGEKEKMAMAAMRVHQQQQRPPVAQAGLLTTATSVAPTSAAQQQQHPTNHLDHASNNATVDLVTTNNNNTAAHSNNLNSNAPATIVGKPGALSGPGGLMPLMMLPYSHMPDNMIGQAYNAAVGHALPAESGSPSGLMGSSSAPAYNQAQEQGKRGAHGGNNGAHGDAAMSHGSSSGGSYGANGHNQHDASSFANNLRPSDSGYAGSGPSSSFGNGISSFGASVAFSDYQTGQSGASGPQQQANSLANNNNYQNNNNNNNNNNNLHHNQSPQQHQQQDDYATQKLKQAKKTIIPIVVQVEHAILENNQLPNSNNNGQRGANKYGGRGHRQLGGKKRHRGTKDNMLQAAGSYRNQQVPFGAASNEGAYDPLAAATAGAQFINAANAHDINQITAAINAENAANAAAALAQADMAFGPGAPAYIGNAQRVPQQHNGANSAHQQQSSRPGSVAQNYASNLHSAASALLAQTHPMIQAAASGGIASVTKLGAKLGEMIALPSMQVPSSISAIGASLPSAFSSLTNQVGAQLNQAVQQVAKEHPAAHAFARQVAQHAGLQLPNLAGSNQLQQQQQQQSAMAQQSSMTYGSSANSPVGLQSLHQQQQQQSQQPQQSNGPVAGGLGATLQQVAASTQHAVQALSPQTQLQNLKLSIGQNLQSAAAQFIGAHQKANAQAAQLLASPLAALYPPSVNAALKQMSLNGVSGQSSAVSMMEPQHAQSSSLIPSLASLGDPLGSLAQAASSSSQQQQQQQGAQQASAPQNAASAAANTLLSNLAAVASGQSPMMSVLSLNNNPEQLFASLQQQQQQPQQASAGSSSSSSSQLSASESSAKPAKASLKSKFLSYFQPPKFISSLFNWGDRAHVDDRSDQAPVVEMLVTSANVTTQSNATAAPVVQSTVTATSGNKTTLAQTTVMTSTTAAAVSESKATSAAPAVTMQPATSANHTQAAANATTSVAPPKST